MTAMIAGDTAKAKAMQVSTCCIIFDAICPQLVEISPHAYVVYDELHPVMDSQKEEAHALVTDAMKRAGVPYIVI